MPETKSIQVDEVLPAPKSGKDSHHGHSHRDKFHREHSHSSDNEPGIGREGATPSSSTSPFSDSSSTLGWKGRLTMTLTQWFFFLRSKSWGKWIYIPAIILTAALVLLLAIPAMLGLIIISIFRRR